MTDLQGTSEATILVKATPHVGKKHGETVCCAGVADSGQWVRLYPVTFRTLNEGQQFGRWDRIKFRWHKPKDDTRPESLRVDHQSIEIVGALKPKERLNCLHRIEVTSINKAELEGKTLVLLRPRDPKFLIRKKGDTDLRKEAEAFKSFAAQADLFNAKQLIPIEPCPFAFKYQYETDDGKREGTCQDWETDATFFKWRSLYGEDSALKRMHKAFGEDYPEKGMVFAMGTHSLYPDKWLINGVIRLDEIKQTSLDI
jgi:hypothetical protein